MKFRAQKAGMDKNEELQLFIDKILSNTKTKTREKKLIENDNQQVIINKNKIDYINKYNPKRVECLKKLVKFI